MPHPGHVICRAEPLVEVMGLTQQGHRTALITSYRGRAPADANGRGGIESRGRVRRLRRHRRTVAGGNCGFLQRAAAGRLENGHSLSETLWDSHKTLAASRSAAARVRVETVKSAGCVIRAVEEYDLVFNSARIGSVLIQRATGRRGAVSLSRTVQVAAPVTSKRYGGVPLFAGGYGQEAAFRVVVGGQAPSGVLGQALERGCGQRLVGFEHPAVAGG
jgi:hypothetical protein